MNGSNPIYSDDLLAVLAKMADLVEFQGLKITDVNERSILGNTPLHIAALSGDVRAGRLLLDAGADPNIQGECGHTPLHEAISRKHYEFVKLLMACGASTELENEDGLTPFDLGKDDPNLRVLLRGSGQ